MKNKRKKAVLLAAFAALFATAGLSACGGTVNDSVNDSGVLNSASEAEHEHTYGEWTVTKEATCTEAGSKQRVCGVCGKTETETIPAGHTYEDGICTVCGEKEPSEGLEYTLNSDNGGYSVTGIGNCTDTDIIIPSSYEGKTVTGIDRAFENCSRLTSVVIPDSVTVIGERAFSNCSGLAGELIISDSVTSLGESVFWNCDKLTSVTIGNGVRSIGATAFGDCSSLKNIPIPDSVTTIGRSAFCQCSQLTSIVIFDRAN